MDTMLTNDLKEQISSFDMPVPTITVFHCWRFYSALIELMKQIRVHPYSLVTSCIRQVGMVLGLVSVASELQDDKVFKVVYICITWLQTVMHDHISVV
jgi:hypothetical protein